VSELDDLLRAAAGWGLAPVVDAGGRVVDMVPQRMGRPAAETRLHQVVSGGRGHLTVSFAHDKRMSRTETLLVFAEMATALDKVADNLREVVRDETRKIELQLGGDNGNV